MSIAMSADHKHSETRMAPAGVKLSLNAPFRLPALKTLSRPQLDERLDPLFELTTEEILMIREKTYAVLDRMDELEAAGQKVPVIEFEEILRGAAVLEQLLAERMQGVVRGKGGEIIRKAEAM